MRNRKPVPGWAQQPLANSSTFWTAIQQQRRSTKRSDGKASFLLEGRRQVAQYLLKRRDNGFCTGPAAWRYFDALATCVATDQETHELVAWAELTLPLLAAQVDLAGESRAGTAAHERKFRGSCCSSPAPSAKAIASPDAS